MRVRIKPGGSVGGQGRVPGDKSIAHRWLILAATASGSSALRDVPSALDVRSTASCLAAVSNEARGPLEAWAARPAPGPHGHGFTLDKGEPRPASSVLELTAAGRVALEVPTRTLDCGNSGTTMRLLAGVLAACPFASALSGDASLRTRPMERVADPLRRMGADVRSADGHAPLEIQGGALHGIDVELAVPSAQVKGAVLLAGLAAAGRTSVREPAPTRDHTERALSHLGAPVTAGEGLVSVEAFQHEGFAASVPGDVSSAVFLIAAAAVTRHELTIEGVGLNPSRTHVLDVLERMGVRVERDATGEELGEPVGTLHVPAGGGLRGTTVEAWELPLVIDEVPVLAALAVHADGASAFLGAGELRVKESDRLHGIAEELRALGGHTSVDGDDLRIGGGGLDGGHADARGDHRMAMALAVGGLGARSEVEVEGIEAAEVSFPGFIETLAGLGAGIEG